MSTSAAGGQEGEELHLHVGELEELVGVLEGVLAVPGQGGGQSLPEELLGPQVVPGVHQAPRQLVPHLLRGGRGGGGGGGVGGGRGGDCGGGGCDAATRADYFVIFSTFNMVNVLVER